MEQHSLFAVVVHGVEAQQSRLYWPGRGYPNVAYCVTLLYSILGEKIIRRRVIETLFRVPLCADSFKSH